MTIYRVVQDAYVRDQGRNVARIDPDSINSLGISFGDPLEISTVSPKTSKSMTVAKCMPLYPSDDEKGIVRFDELVRNNSGAVAIGDNVILKKVEALPAKKVILTQIEPILPVPAKYPPIDGEWIVDCLKTMPVIKGDTVKVPYFGGRTWFQVIDVNPAEPVVINRHTKCEFTEAKYLTG